MAKPFDFKHPLFLEFPISHQELLKRAYKSGMTGSDFMEARLAIPPSGRHKNKLMYGATRTKKIYAEYVRLKERYDFFTP